MAEPTIEIEALEEGKIRIRTDTPGERATSAVVNGHELIAQIQAAMGLEPAPGQPTDA